LKTSSRKSGNSNLADELVALEVSLGFGVGDDFQPEQSRIEDHQLRILELIDNSEEPETKEPETEESETKEPETKEPETKEPETKEPETKEPETEEPEIEETIIEYETTDEKQMLGESETVTDLKIVNQLTQDVVETNEDKTDKHGIIQLVMCNCPGRDAARELARNLIEARLAACINIIANIGSIYWWQGEIHDTAECQLQIKTSHQSLNDVIDYIKQHHPGDVPEILVIPINEGNEEYFEWVKQETYDRE